MFTYNPWLGCHKMSRGCQNCYLFNFDNDKVNTNVIVKNENNFDILVRKKRGQYVIRGGQEVIVCQKSDFFIEEADAYRDEVYKMIKEREDLHFILLTKRIDRAKNNLPEDWGEGYPNVTITVSCCDQESFDYRVRYLLELKAKSKTIMIAPLLDRIDITKLIKSKDDIEYINCGGENYKGARPVVYEYAKEISDATLRLGIPFYFFDTGAYLIKEGKTYFIPYEKRYSQAFLSNLSHN